MRQSDNALPSNPSTLFTTAFNNASIRATRTLSVGSMPGCLMTGALVSAFPSSIFTSLPPALTGGLPARV
jgi:hypothetical protein